MDIFDEIIKRYAAEIQNLKNTLADGNADSYESYKQLVGTITGIEWARTQFIETLKQRNYTEED
jgi:hypothetical protein|tara:strand:+ start:4235 stop:4426 length:192 start_codon:yes stop_codon:yes gene_type:complete